MSLTDEDKQWIKDQFRQSQEAAVANLSELREELRLRLDRIDNKLERMDTRMAAQAIEIAGMSNAIAITEQAEARRMAIQSRQQAAIDELYRRLPPTGT
jgi:hypothetical protein